MTDLPVEVSMYCNCRAIVEAEGEQGREILIQIGEKPCEGGISLELPGGRLEESESLGDIPGWIALAGFVFFMFFQSMIERRARKAAASTVGA